MTATQVVEEHHVTLLTPAGPQTTAYATRDLALQAAAQLQAANPGAMIAIKRRVISDTIEGVFGAAGLPPLPKSAQALIVTESVPTGYPQELVRAKVG